MAALVIGDRDQGPDQALFRVVDAHRFPDGRIVVANAGTQELRFFNAQGQFAYAAGGKGGGPGEFNWMMWMQLIVDDSLVVMDGRPLALEVFDSHGNLGRRVNLASSTSLGSIIPIVVFDDGQYLGEPLTRMTAEPTGGIVRTKASLQLMGPSGEPLDSAGTYPGIDIWVGPRPDGRMGRATPFFGKTTRFHRHGDDLVVADNANPGFDVYSRTGEPVMKVRWLRSDSVVTPEDIARGREFRLQGLSGPNQRRSMAMWYERVPGAEFRPAFDELFVDDDGRFWLKEYTPPGIESTGRWSIYGSDGVYVGWIDLFDSTPMHVTADFVLAVRRDALDVEVLQLHKLESVTR